MSVAGSTHALLEDHSLEMTAKDVGNLAEARALIRPGTRINITYLGTEDLSMRRAAAAAVKEWGFVPVPHIAARRLESEVELSEFIGALEEDGTGTDVFVIGGDPDKPAGPYRDSLDIIRSGILAEHGVQRIGLAGYPEGHPHIPTQDLFSALKAKAAVLKEQNVPGVIVTQFGFDVDPVLSWLDAVRNEGIDMPIRIGVPGPAGIKRLLGYARRFGVGSSAGIARKYGFSIMNLLGTAGPGRYIGDLASRIDPARHGEVKLHFYAFGGLSVTSEWIREFEEDQNNVE